MEDREIAYWVLGAALVVAAVAVWVWWVVPPQNLLRPVYDVM